jgi:hypothetical protein
MQFVPGGPDVPHALLRAHEDGQVIFFCGAGISTAAGLPLFGELTERIFAAVGAPCPKTSEGEATIPYDVLLDQLERGPGAARVRRALPALLEPDCVRPHATSVHEALLRLANRSGAAPGVVTTNYDRLFEQAAKRLSIDLPGHYAPALPLPRPGRWDGLVYLHGRLPEVPREQDLAALVLTSGDFGRAYLTEQWAARFVAELFRHYVVCFVGYAINDPIVRYMMDAMSADARSGHAVPTAYALGACIAGKEDDEARGWLARGAVPILYRVETYRGDHAALRDTLDAWANVWSGGVAGKERLVIEGIRIGPARSSPHDDHLGRVVWALADDTGLPAKVFSRAHPAPSLDWLDVLEERRFNAADLGLSVGTALSDGAGPFSLFDRPAKDMHALPLVSGSGEVDWDRVTLRMAEWLVRHLHSPRLLDWVSLRGAALHPRLIDLIRRRLDEIDKAHRAPGEGASAENTDPVPDAVTRAVWRLACAGYLKSSQASPSLYQWKLRWDVEGMTWTMRQALGDALGPVVVVGQRLAFLETDSTRLDVHVSLRADDIESCVDELRASKAWKTALPGLIDLFERNLRDALALHSALGLDRGYDPTAGPLAHLEPGEVNYIPDEWVRLALLMRDAWIEIEYTDKSRALDLVRAWAVSRHDVFRKLALFGAGRLDGMPLGERLGLLLGGKGVLWAPNFQSHVAEYLARIGPRLTPPTRHRLESVIARGPARPTGLKTLPREAWTVMKDDESSHHFLALGREAPLGTIGNAAMAAIVGRRPGREDEPEAPPYPAFEDGALFVATPIQPDLQSAIDFLRTLKPSDPPGYAWPTFCGAHPAFAIGALVALAGSGEWPVNAWRQALMTLARSSKATWEPLGPVLTDVPESVLLEAGHEIAEWMRGAVRAGHDEGAKVVPLVGRLVGLEWTPPDPDEAFLFQAQVHPAYIVVTASVEAWLKTNPANASVLSPTFAAVWATVCHPDRDDLWPGVYALVTHLASLHAVDEAWTSHHLLPRLDWNCPRAAEAWSGVLNTPRFTPALLNSIGAPFLGIADHLSSFDTHRQKRFAETLVHLATANPPPFAFTRLNQTLATLPPALLEDCVSALKSVLRGNGDDRALTWATRIAPFWTGAWPKTGPVTPGLAQKLAELVALAGGAFPEAFELIGDWLAPTRHPAFVFQTMIEAKLCTLFPEAALAFIARFLALEHTHPYPLPDCLAEIAKAAPALEHTETYRMLFDHARMLNLIL